MVREFGTLLLPALLGACSAGADAHVSIPMPQEADVTLALEVGDVLGGSITMAQRVDSMHRRERYRFDLEVTAFVHRVDDRGATLIAHAEADGEGGVRTFRFVLDERGHVVGTPTVVDGGGPSRRTKVIAAMIAEGLSPIGDPATPRVRVEGRVDDGDGVRLRARGDWTRGYRVHGRAQTMRWSETARVDYAAPEPFVTAVQRESVGRGAGVTVEHALLAHWAIERGRGLPPCGPSFAEPLRVCPWTRQGRDFVPEPVAPRPVPWP